MLHSTILRRTARQGSLLALGFLWAAARLYSRDATSCGPTASAAASIVLLACSFSLMSATLQVKAHDCSRAGLPVHQVSGAVTLLPHCFIDQALMQCCVHAGEAVGHGCQRHASSAGAQQQIRIVRLSLLLHGAIHSSQCLTLGEGWVGGTGADHLKLLGHHLHAESDDTHKVCCCCVAIRPAATARGCYDPLRAGSLRL